MRCGPVACYLRGKVPPQVYMYVLLVAVVVLYLARSRGSITQQENLLLPEVSKFQPSEPRGAATPNLDARGDVAAFRHKCSKVEARYIENNTNWMQLDRKNIQIIVDKAHRFKFCMIWKVGTQTWRSLAAALLNHTDVTNITFLKDLTTAEQDVAVDSYRAAMFVRDPWSRLWSAYNDKFANFHPHFLIKYRLGFASVMPAADGCLHNITFSDFVELILFQHRTRRSFDTHWRPFWSLCHPCGYDYAFVGRLESGRAGVAAMIERLRLGEPEALLKKMKSDNYSCAWFPAERDLFGNDHGRKSRQYPDKCQSARFALAAKWRSLINQGYLGPGEPHPEWFSQVPDITLQQLDRAARQVLYKGVQRALIERSAMYTKEQQRGMKAARLAQAVDTLSEKQICAIEDIYKPDFELFDYPRKCFTQ